MNFDFTPVVTAKIPTAHFARLCGASRVSAFKWMRGEANPRGLYCRAVQATLAKISRALDRGALPLPAGTRRDEKYDALLRALKA